VYRVDSVELSIIKTDPPQLDIKARGTVRTGGYRDGELVEIVYVDAPADGIWEYDFVAVPPSGPSIQVLTPIEAHTVRPSIPDGLKGIRVRGETNSVEETL
ncbi:MAG: hypothetical protein LC667_04265, partial [Thioalkalivibrio sp.]|nr:hypothetical protein [Thioalkalivibrio sp.]